MAAEILDTALKLKKATGSKYTLSIRWTTGHSGMKGDEDVDEEEKAASEGQTTEIAMPSKSLKSP